MIIPKIVAYLAFAMLFAGQVISTAAGVAASSAALAVDVTGHNSSEGKSLLSIFTLSLR